ncbi:hypothetical protein CEXT_5861 [Caerostris extrusa]|uniref:Uncharacterized protein n=1 Tax=Caerostris extrusa TaxID=172846 RepID=A0AAV4SPP5_CAEEX|nr:hypothetical protein CEXT_5861 [Caerostris extrusa]
MCNKPHSHQGVKPCPITGHQHRTQALVMGRHFKLWCECGSKNAIPPQVRKVGALVHKTLDSFTPSEKYPPPPLRMRFDRWGRRPRGAESGSVRCSGGIDRGWPGRALHLRTGGGVH